MTIANYTSEKGHRELLYVYKRLPVSKATLISAGSFTPGIGDYDLFEQQATRINLGRKFLGKRVVMVDGQDRELIRDLLKCADLFLFLSNIEASPLVLFEATAAGVPFVATAAGNSTEIAKWTGGGVIVKTHQRENGRVAADLKNALWQVTRLARNPERRHALGAAGHKAWQNKYTWQKITKQYLGLYEDLLKAKASKK
jgi:glycosyltransferase involved in cell wall biosynthesis